ncbi:MAG: YceI family protein [Oligoflexales bacterium]
MMRMKANFKVIMIFFGMLISCMMGASEGSDASSNWVKWHAKKRMFLLSNQEPVGINTKIEVSLVPDKQNYLLRIEIPLAEFNSDEADRDAEVVKMLKGDLNKNLVFQSRSYSQAELNGMLKTVSHTIPGKLRIGEKWHDLKFTVEIKEHLLTGSMESKLSSLDIEPPSMLGGLMVKVDDYIKLSVQLNLESLLKDLYKG